MKGVVVPITTTCFENMGVLSECPISFPPVTNTVSGIAILVLVLEFLPRHNFNGIRLGILLFDSRDTVYTTYYVGQSPENRYTLQLDDLGS